MTRDEILQNGNWTSDNLFQIISFSEAFDQDVKIAVYISINGNRIISDKAVNAINQFISLDRSQKTRVEDEIWKHCLACNQTQISKGSRDGGKTWFDTSSTLDENLARYEINNREDALKKYEIVDVLIYNDPDTNGDYIIQIETPWDYGHLIMVHFENNQLTHVEN